MRYPYRPFLLLLIVFCSSSSAIEYEIEIAESYTDSDILEYVESKLVYTIQESADEVTLQVQSFPKFVFLTAKELSSSPLGVESQLLPIQKGIS